MPSLSRRKLLAAVGSAVSVPLAGCVLGSSPENPRISLAESDTIPDEYQFSVNVSVIEPLVTEGHPARIRINTTNRGPTRRVGLKQPYLFPPHDNYTSDPDGLVIYLESMEDASDLPNDGDGRWSIRPTGGGGMTGSFLFPSGDSVENGYRVLDDSSAIGYFATGEYRFARSFWFSSEDAEDRREFEWGFSLRVGPDE